MKDFLELLQRGARKRISLAELRQHYFSLYPGVQNSPDRSARLLETLRQLETIGALSLPAVGSWEKIGVPPLPPWVLLKREPKAAPRKDSSTVRQKSARRRSVLRWSFISGCWHTACDAIRPSASHLTPPAWRDGLARNWLPRSPNSGRANIGFHRSRWVSSNCRQVYCECSNKTLLALKATALVH